MEDNGYTNKEKAYDDIAAWLKRDADMKNGVSDLVKGLTNGKSVGYWEHDSDYYTEDSIAKEAFAHFFEAGMSDTSIKLDYIKEVFPNAYEEYVKMIKEELD